MEIPSIPLEREFVFSIIPAEVPKLSLTGLLVPCPSWRQESEVGPIPQRRVQGLYLEGEWMWGRANHRCPHRCVCPAIWNYSQALCSYVKSSLEAHCSHFLKRLSFIWPAHMQPYLSSLVLARVHPNVSPGLALDSSL